MCRDFFREYFSDAVVKRFKHDEAYQEIQAKINALYEQYPKVLSVFDSDHPVTLSEQECEAVIEIMSLKSEITNMEMETVYFRGCYDGVAYVRIAGVM